MRARIEKTSDKKRIAKSVRLGERIEEEEAVKQRESGFIVGGHTSAQEEEAPGRNATMGRCGLKR